MRTEVSRARGAEPRGGRVTSPNQREHSVLSIGYLCLQPRREGQASVAHVNGIVDGLRALGWRVALVEPPTSPRSIASRVCAMLWAQARYLMLLHRSEVAYIRNHFAAWPAVMVARVAGRVVVIEVNGTYDDVFVAWPGARRFAGLINWLSRSQMRSADGLIVVTQELGEWAEAESNGRPIAVIPNAADTDYFAPAVQPESAEPYVVFVGALAKWQGVSVMLDAVKHPEWPEGVTLRIAGDGQMANDCREADGRDGVRYLGRVPFSDVPDLLAGAIASLSVQTPTAGRGTTGVLPVKLFEGLASGRPIIVSDLPGQGPLVEKAGCGIVIPTGDSAALARAVREISSDPDLRERMGKLARDIAVSDHSWSERARSTASFLVRLARKDRRGLYPSADPGNGEHP